MFWRFLCLQLSNGEIRPHWLFSTLGICFGNYVLCLFHSILLFCPLILLWPMDVFLLEFTSPSRETKSGEESIMARIGSCDWWPDAPGVGRHRGKKALSSDVAVSLCLRWLRIVATERTRQFEELAEKFFFLLWLKGPGLLFAKARRSIQTNEIRERVA